MSRGIQKTFPGMSKLEPRKSKQTGLPPTQRYNQEERQIQADLFYFLRTFKHIVPQFGFVSASMNGIYLATEKQRGDADRAGRTKGIWDIAVPGLRTINGKICGGMFMETKSRTGRLEPEQIAFQVMFCDDYAFIVYRDWITGARAICDYYGVTDPRVWDNLKINEKATTSTKVPKP